MLQTGETNQKLMKSIEELRGAMIECFKNKGIQDITTVQLSQELDKLILMYQKQHRAI